LAKFSHAESAAQTHLVKERVIRPCLDRAAGEGRMRFEARPGKQHTTYQRFLWGFERDLYDGKPPEITHFGKFGEALAER
jgi:hypothetical protein